MSQLQNKLLNHEVTPPAGVWEKIANALDESELLHEFPSRLYDAEVIPPITTWNRIANSLDEENEAAIPERRRLSPLLKYAAAAVVIGLIAWGGIKLLNNKTGNKELAKQDIPQPQKDNFVPSTDLTVRTPDVNTTSTDITAQADEKRNDAALEASKKTFAKLDMPVKSRMKNIAAGYYFASSVEPGNVAETIQSGTINTTDLASCYITLMTPEGNIIRVSKKLSDLVCCVSGAEQDADCKDQMQRWREKIACTPGTHSPGNFMDILTLVSSLQED